MSGARGCSHRGTWGRSQAASSPPRSLGRSQAVSSPPMPSPLQTGCQTHETGPGGPVAQSPHAPLYRREITFLQIHVRANHPIGKPILPPVPGPQQKSHQHVPENHAEGETRFRKPLDSVETPPGRAPGNPVYRPLRTPAETWRRLEADMHCDLHSTLCHQRSARRDPAAGALGPGGAASPSGHHGPYRPGSPTSPNREPTPRLPAQTEALGARRPCGSRGLAGAVGWTPKCVVDGGGQAWGVWRGRICRGPAGVRHARSPRSDNLMALSGSNLGSGVHAGLASQPRFQKGSGTCFLSQTSRRPGLGQ